MLKAADERLINRFQPTVRQQMAWFITLRGWYAGRALLVKDDEGETYVDIQPWDPMHTYWGEGRKGIAWACYKTIKTPSEIKAIWGVDLQGDGTDNTDEEGIDVYDFYDSEDNIVCTDDTVLKKRTKLFNILYRKWIVSIVILLHTYLFPLIKILFRIISRRNFLT